MSASRFPADATLYAIVDLGYVSPADAAAAARALIAGGADVLQLRAKQQPHDVIRRVAREVLPLCRDAAIPLILNDFPEIAAEIDVDGVHLGQDDGPISQARTLIGPGRPVGRSTHSLEQARAALAEGADYIGFGPLFPTPTKLGRPGIGLADIAAMHREVGSRIPAFCIGGIRRDTLNQVVEHGARRVVIVSDLLTAPDIAAATRAAKQQLHTALAMQAADA